MADQRTDFVPLAPIVVTRANGLSRAFGLGAATAAARGTALLSAATYAATLSASVRIKLAAGSYEIGNNTVNVPADCTLDGSGLGVTKITSNLRVDGCIVHPGNNSVTSNLTIQGTSTSLFQFPWGTKGTASEDPFTNATLLNCELIGDTDGFYVNHTTACSGRAIDCVFTTLFDAVRIFHQNTDTNPAHAFEFHGCKITATGPSVVSALGETRPVYHGSISLACNNNVSKYYNCIFTGSNAGASLCSPVYATGPGSTNGAKIELHGGCTISSSGGSSNYDLNATGGAIISVGPAVKYDSSKTLEATTGTIVKLATFGTTPTTAGLALLGGASASAQRTSLGASNGTWLAANQQCTTFLALSGGAVSGSFSSMGAGSSALINFATTDPQITITTAGTYLIIARVVIISPGLSAASGGSCALTLRRTNNTAANLTGAAATISFGDDGGLTESKSVTITAIYTTANTNDVIELWGNDVASIGLTASNPQITAIQLGTGSI